MSEKSNEKKADEQAKAQNLFARWRKEETLYKEDEKESSKSNDSKTSSDEEQK
ncbi:hypothetical protein ACQE30_01170 [Staphylococcus cohnii]|uniref:Uncharacterized protein n=2 Tax=Staphylococcus cohnii TaxID=29382 RepID=A0ABT6IWQ5_9STAP|nr:MULTISPECIES: hypothetical protein [Staphylococcus]KKI63525.1 hypothetical protein UF66_0572 [Staphylococcus cohnii subsp. cohnii]MBB2508072.1 hypothetical protein [Staphylococcus cohnii subsp. barensis]MCE5033111.1 hypothetical protein [Staphylococcus cohnii]MCE5098910.1 hypothetical protein [Staphylococcus cohnii]MCI2940013.1 hypothetical protein [Staphylococcus cohnii]